MILGEKSSRTYKLNEATQVTVNSERVADGVHKHKVVVTHIKLTTSPLEFPTKAAVRELVEGLDLEDNQLSIDMGANDE